ncbi:hypothetical protein [Nostoc sp.]
MKTAVIHAIATKAASINDLIETITLLQSALPLHALVFTKVLDYTK